MKRVFLALFSLGLMFSQLEGIESSIDKYGKQYLFMGVIKEYSSSDFRIQGKEDSNESVLAICLDIPITKLPFPVVPGNIMYSPSGIETVMIHLPKDLPKNKIRKGKRVKIKGSLWYADWLSETNPLLLIADQLEIIP